MLISKINFYSPYFSGKKHRDLPDNDNVNKFISEISDEELKRKLLRAQWYLSNAYIWEHCTQKDMETFEKIVFNTGNINDTVVKELTKEGISAIYEKKGSEYKLAEILKLQNAIIHPEEELPFINLYQDEELEPIRKTVVYKNEKCLHYLKNYIKEYFDENPIECRYLYKNYYLNTLPPVQKKHCAHILKRFGTYVFLENPKEVNSSAYILAELNNWDSAGGVFVNYPAVIDTSRLQQVFAEEKNAIGIFDGYIISIKKAENLRQVLRHEMMHCNDEFYDMPLFGKFNDIDFSKDGDILTNKSWYRQELLDAGISESLVDYAYTKKQEFVAVAAEGDMSKYSKEFKSDLMKLGMPEWVFNLQYNK